jgi:hypothetical protein
MRMDIAWKTANLTFIGPFGIAIAGLNVGAESKSVARSAPVRLVNCNIRDTLYPWVDTEPLNLDLRKETCSS